MHTDSLSQVSLLGPSSHKIFSKSHRYDSSTINSDALYIDQNNFSGPLIDKALRFLSYGRMTISDIRKAKLEELISEYGSLRALAEKLDHSATAQISQWRNSAPDFKSGKPRTISDRSARHIELKCGKPVGWMDTPSQTAQGALLDDVQWIIEHGRPNEISILIGAIEAIKTASKNMDVKQSVTEEIQNKA